MEKSLIHLSNNEILQKINELKTMQKILEEAKFIYYPPSLKVEYNKCIIRDEHDYKVGMYFFVDEISQYYDGENRTITSRGPGLFLCKKIEYKKELEDVGLFGRKKYRAYKLITFTKVWGTINNHKIVYNYSEKGNEIKEILDDELSYDLDDKQSYYMTIGDVSHYYDSISSATYVNKEKADVFYKHYLLNQKNELMKNEEQYKKYLYVSLKIRELEEEIIKRDLRDKHNVISSLSVDEEDLKLLLKKYK